MHGVLFSGILQGVYWGLGGGLGAIVGGVFIDEYGAVPSFFFGALCSIVLLIVFSLAHVCVSRNDNHSKGWEPVELK